MTPDNEPSYFAQVAGAIIISLTSGLISVGRRLLKGTGLPLLWVVTEVGAAVLVGFLAWDTYPNLQDSMPHSITRLIFTCACAHLGGRILQHAENIIEAKLLSGSNVNPK